MNIVVPADVAAELEAAAREEGRSAADEGVALLRRALAGRRLGSLLAKAGSDVGDDEAMTVAIGEQRAARLRR